MIRVNGELLDPNMFEEAFARIKSEAEAISQTTGRERDQEFSQAAEDEVINSVLIAQEAAKAPGELSEEEIAARVEELRSYYREAGAAPELLNDRDSLCEAAKANLQIDRYMDENLPALVSPTKSELEDYYQSCKKDYRSLPEVHCLHLIKMIDGCDDHRALLEEMTALRRQALTGADFQSLAEAETEKSGGEVDMGWIPLDRPTNPFETILFSLQEEEVSPVISYEQALHLVKVIRRKGGEEAAFEDVSSELMHRYLLEKRRSAVRKLASGLRKKAVIESVDFSAE